MMAFRFGCRLLGMPLVTAVAWGFSFVELVRKGVGMLHIAVKG
jgi:hypothetical protein